MLPPLDYYFAAMRRLGLENIPPWKGEPENELECLEAIDAIIACCRKATLVPGTINGPPPPELATSSGNSLPLDLLPVWRAKLLKLRADFQEWASRVPKLRHFVVLPLTKGMRMPGILSAHMSANLNAVHFCDCWRWHYPELPELAYLYGPPTEAVRFIELAHTAFLTLPLGNDIPMIPAEEYDKWLRFVYAILRRHFYSYLAADRKLCLVGGNEGREIIYQFSPVQEKYADEDKWAGCPRYRVTCLSVDPFTASAAAIDALTDEQAVRSWHLGETLAEPAASKAQTPTPGGTAVELSAGEVQVVAPFPSQPQYVTLDQMAAMVSRSKRTLEKLTWHGKDARFTSRSIPTR
jgi:hypothetical protein